MHLTERPTFIDTHCHLYWDSFATDLDDVIQRAAEAGVTRCIVPATNLETLEQALALAHRYDSLFVAAGIHPHDAFAVPDDFIERLRSFAADPRVVAIGEIGLDYHYDFTPKEKQHAVLRAQLRLAKELALPVILHNRESDDDLISILGDEQDGNLRGQFHCFSQDVPLARRALDLGFHISFTGNVTHKKSTLDEVLAFIPDDRLLIETDAPFMAPAPHRGKRNEPMHIPLIAERFATTRKQTVEQIARVTTENAEKLFGVTRKHA